MLLVSVFTQLLSWSFFYLRTFPDLCLSSLLRHVDPPIVFAESLLCAIHGILLEASQFNVVVQMIIEVLYTTPVYDPVYHICKTIISYLSYLTLLLPKFARQYFQYRTWKLPPFIEHSILTLTRCTFMGIMRTLWEAHYKVFYFPDPNEAIQKSVIFIFVKFFLGAPASLVCIYWILIIVYQYIFKFQRKTYNDLLLLSVLSLIYVGIVEWNGGFHVLSLTYVFISYMTFFYWLLY